MRTSRKLTHFLLAMLALALMSVVSLAADPGAPYPATSEVSDQKAGSVLIYNIYTSAASGGNTQNTRVNITNTNLTSAAFVHLFFVSADCTIADSYICLTAAQTASFLASDVDPGVKGYILAVAVDNAGCPIAYNFLIGDEYVKFSSGHAANLGAEAISALAGGLTACNQNSSTATLAFDGISYTTVPHVLAADNIGSRADGNDTLLILNRIGGNLGVGGGGQFFGGFGGNTLQQNLGQLGIQGGGGGFGFGGGMVVRGTERYGYGGVTRESVRSLLRPHDTASRLFDDGVPPPGKLANQSGLAATRTPCDQHHS